MADDVTLPGTGQAIATDDIGGRQFQRIKMVTGADGVNEGDISNANPMPVGGADADYWPGAGGVVPGKSVATIDPDGAIITRGAVTTDEGSFRANFTGTSLGVGIGTLTLTNGSRAVTGTGLLSGVLEAGDYVKLDADAESAWAQVDTIDSDTAATLVANYTGTGGSSAGSRARIRPITGAGGTIAVASGVATITCGTTAAALHRLDRRVDYSPLLYQGGVMVSQRIANQDICIGAWDDATTPKWFAQFRLNGTTNTTVICESGFNPTGSPSAAETETTTITVPGGLTTAVSLRYRIEALVDKVRFFINGQLVAEHYRAMPGPYRVLATGVRVVNGTTPASSTTVTVDYVSVQNIDRLAVSISSEHDVVRSRGYLETVTGAIAANGQTVSIPCDGATSVAVDVRGTFTATIVVELTYDGVNWVSAASCFNPSTAALASSITTALVLVAPTVGAVAARARCSAYTSGTANVVLRASASQHPVSESRIIGTASASLAASTNLVGDVGLQFRANATGAASISHLVSAATTNAANVKASAGRVVGWHFTNTNAAYRYVKLHNTAGTPTAGTGVVMTIAIPPNGVAVMPVGGAGIGFATGIGRTVVTGAADADATAVGANDVVGDLFFA